MHIKIYIYTFMQSLCGGGFLLLFLQFNVHDKIFIQNEKLFQGEFHSFSEFTGVCGFVLIF